MMFPGMAAAQGPAPAKNTKEEAEQAQKFSAEHVQHNMQVLAYFRNYMAILGGCISGVLGLTSLYGIAAFFLTFIAGSLFLIVKGKGSLGHFFPIPRQVLSSGIMTGLLSYILFWTLLYNVFHVY